MGIKLAPRPGIKTLSFRQSKGHKSLEYQLHVNKGFKVVHGQIFLEPSTAFDPGESLRKRRSEVRD